MTYRNLIFEEENHVATLTINHPPANTWDLATMQDFKQALDTVEANDDTRVVIITGAGEKFFSCGFDLKDDANADRITPMARQLWRRIDMFSKPVAAAINGYALGGGLELALCCHFRIMADRPDIKVGLTELNLGLIPGWGGTQRLLRLVGREKALEMILLSSTIGAKEALEMGLASRLAPPDTFREYTLAFAAALAERPPVAVAWALRAISAGLYSGLDEGLLVEARGTEAVRETEDRKEGFAAFLEKRKPAFKGK